MRNNVLERYSEQPYDLTRDAQHDERGLSGFVDGRRPPRGLRDRTPAPPPGYNRRLLFARGRPRRSHYRGERERCRTAFLLSFWNPTATTGIANYVGIEALQVVWGFALAA